MLCTNLMSITAIKISHDLYLKSDISNEGFKFHTHFKTSLTFFSKLMRSIFSYVESFAGYQGNNLRAYIKYLNSEKTFKFAKIVKSI